MCFIKRNKKKLVSPKNTADNGLHGKELATLQYHNALTFGKLSFELEEKREQSLINQSGHMLTAFSLYSAVLIALLAIYMERRSFSTIYLWFSATCISAPLIFAFIFTGFAQWRYKYLTLDTAETYRKIFRDNITAYSNQYQFDYQLIQQLHQMQESKTNNNDKRLLFIKIAMVCFLVSIVMLILSYAFFSYIFWRGV